MQKNDKGLNKHEIKIEKYNKDNLIQFFRAISKEIESNTCPICLELMLPPLHSPMLIFPCGHSFWYYLGIAKINVISKACLQIHTQKNRRVCPYCRTKV